MELNFSPLLTTRNYGINYAKVDDCLFCQNISSFENVKIYNDFDFLRKNKQKVEIVNKIGDPFDDQLLKECNKNMYFEIDKSEEKPLIINFDFDDKNVSLLENISFKVKENVQTKVVILFMGAKAYHNGIVKFWLEKNAKVDVALVCHFEEKSLNLLRIFNQLEENSILNFNLIDFGGGTSIQNFYTKLEGQACQSNLNSLYFGAGKDLLDLNYVQDVYGKNSKTNIQCVGALTGQAVKHFKGTIKFEKGCTKSAGGEDELCLLISKEAKSKTLPMLLCTEEDVDGKHSSSVGKVGGKELFYIMSRGLTKAEALRLVVKAKFSVVLDKIFDEELKKKLIEIVDGKLSYEE